MEIFTATKIAQVKDWIDNAQSIVVIAHKSPDGDSIGSSVGLYHYLKKKGGNVQICHPDPAPYFLHWMKGSETILNDEENSEATREKIRQADLLFCLDFNTPSRVGNLTPILEKATAKKIMIDHHLHPSTNFDLVFSDPESCSTAQLIADFISAMNDDNLLDKNIGDALYCGIMTDTGSFRFPSVTSHTHEVIAKLMKAGVLPFQIHEAVFDTNTLDKLKLRSYAINENTEILTDSKTVIIYLKKEDLARFNYVKGDTEGLVNVGLSIQGIMKSIFLMEIDGIIKISFRSKGADNPVNEMASNYFYGGGHANAAGGRWIGTLEEAIEKVKDVLPEYTH